MGGSKRKKYQIFSGFEIRRLAELHQVKQLKIRIFKNISDQAILDFSFSFLSLIKLYMPQTKYGIGSLFTLLKNSGRGEVMNTYLGRNSDTVLHGAKAFQLSHKQMRTQIRHSKKEGK
ncbi:MAG: hypothetical protein HWE34_15755 [Methylocystaceae bacterium]|nr:hypothetical protein [Methylocystaceae bacterium]